VGRSASFGQADRVVHEMRRSESDIFDLLMQRALRGARACKYPTGLVRHPVFLAILSQECGQAVGHRNGVGAIAFDHAQDQDLAFEVYVFPVKLLDTASARSGLLKFAFEFLMGLL
jgi:hypothetical protein